MTKHSARRCAADERFGTGSARVKDRLGKDYGRGGQQFWLWWLADKLSGLWRARLVDVERLRLT